MPASSSWFALTTMPTPLCTRKDAKSAGTELGSHGDRSSPISANSLQTVCTEHAESWLAVDGVRTMSLAVHRVLAPEAIESQPLLGEIRLHVAGLGSTALIVGSEDTINKPGMIQVASKQMACMLYSDTAASSSASSSMQTRSSQLRFEAISKPAQVSKTVSSLWGSGLADLDHEQTNLALESSPMVSASCLADQACFAIM
mmetsp:Transcript_59088/g.118211  ORF Transcript_59088/g.118211 Transcript_59088/m.118211 type:complete len:201 (-) Transcript_59088:424-1026(-)